VLFLLFLLRRVSRGVIVNITLGLATLALTMLLAGGGMMYLPIARGGVLLLGCSLALMLDRNRLPCPSLVAAVSAGGLVLTVIFAGDPAKVVPRRRSQG
jgi:hypothetical protein